jgi:hypothetical protein
MSFLQLNQYKKATGQDGISANILKIVKPVIAKPISELINKSISLAKFPEKLKEAQIKVTTGL